MNARLVPVSAEPSTSREMSQARMIDTLKGLLRDSFQLRNQGSSAAKLAHAQGYADGYMKMLMDGGFLSQRELLQIVQDVRRGVDGPATVVLSPAANVA